MRKKDYLFGIATVLFIAVILFCSTQTVMSQEKTDKISSKQYYAAMEQKYLADMQQMLTDMGYQNSGITIRWVADETGHRNYTVMIHHWKIDKLNMQERKELQEVLSKTEFEDTDCTFCYEFWTA